MESSNDKFVFENVILFTSICGKYTDNFNKFMEEYQRIDTEYKKITSDPDTTPNDETFAILDKYLKLRKCVIDLKMGLSLENKESTYNDTVNILKDIQISVDDNDNDKYKNDFLSEMNKKIEEVRKPFQNVCDLVSGCDRKPSSIEEMFFEIENIILKY